MKPLKSGSPMMEQHPIRNTAPVTGIRRCKPPSSSRSTVWRGICNRAGAKEQETLEERVIKGVQQSPGQGQSRPNTRVVRHENQGGAKPQIDDPDVLDTVVRKQPLEVVLGDRVQNTQES